MTHEQALARIERLEAALRYCRNEMVGMRARARSTLNPWLVAVAGRAMTEIDAALAPQEETR